ncbi:3'-5' exonuclease [Pseudomonas sp. HUK17]|uniref:3'-5' exonuclease n=1 Tax=Pseudomonas sp. HUK17 TaxID=1799359 RepID=UPI0007934BC8|nr:3'-5' exonuclease [Pseudomonas sp. HUK17]KXJ32945.1 DNA polymerase III subunit epsilon [Pseudomonas sp. HUK17]
MNSLSSSFSTAAVTGYNAQQMRVREQARRWLEQDVLVLDTEATGLGEEAQLIEVAVMTLGGRVLLDTLVRPSIAVPREATLIHGLTDAHLSQAPSFPEVFAQLWPLLQGRTVLAYGMAFDYRLLGHDAQLHGLALPPELERETPPVQLVDGTRLHCLMQLYAQFWQEPSLDSRSQDGWRRKSLAMAARQQGIAVQETHRALPDCRLKAALVQALGEDAPATWSGLQALAG